MPGQGLFFVVPIVLTVRNNLFLRNEWLYTGIRVLCLIAQRGYLR